ncbi:hypothetical protein [Rhizobium phage RHph_X2_24]|nr:hypothetical protein [Rhizobium phage RHph_X2_24]
MTDAEKITAILELLDMLLTAMFMNNREQQIALLHEIKELRETVQ